MPTQGHSVPIERLEIATFQVPTEFPEADGTLQWDHTKLLVVCAFAGNEQGIGYTYAGRAAAEIVAGEFERILTFHNAVDPTAAYMKMWQRVRNMGRQGICSMAISAVDCAIWDLKARLLGLPLVTLLGQVRERAPVYGSGGFTSYSDQQLADQLAGLAKEEIGAVKMKIGSDPERDQVRLRVAREATPANTKLYVDANGAFSPRQALEQLDLLLADDVRWYEEPVSSDCLNQLRFVREHAPEKIRIAAGEYGYEPFYFERMLDSEAVDVLQADITRCGGVTGFMQIAALCQAHNVPLSGHTAPALHAHPACAAIPFSELEYFHDHVRIEQMFFDGVPELIHGSLQPDSSRPGNGLHLRRKDVERFAA